MTRRNGLKIVLVEQKLIDTFKGNQSVLVHSRRDVSNAVKLKAPGVS